MCQCSRIDDNSPSGRHRRMAILLAAFTAILGIVPALMISIRHLPWLRWCVIALQIVLLAAAAHQLSLARRRCNEPR